MFVLHQQPQKLFLLCWVSSSAAPATSFPLRYIAKGAVPLRHLRLQGALLLPVCSVTFAPVPQPDPCAFKALRFT